MNRNDLARNVALRLLSEMEGHGGPSDFCEKLRSDPEQYALHLAFAAIYEIELNCMMKTYRQH